MRGRPALPRAVLASVWIGVAVCWALIVFLTRVTGLAVADAVLLSVLLVAMPVLSLVQAPLLARAEIERLPAYWSSIVTLWILGTLAWLVGTREGGLPAIGAAWLPPIPLLAWSLGLTAAGIAVIVAFRWVAKAAGVADSRVVHDLMPRTSEEKGVFVVLSIAAGVGEEVAYRGYAISVLLPLIGPLAAVLTTSAVFGVLHVYQGGLGVLRTGTMGVVLAWGFLASGSLFTVVLAHTLIDLLAGLVLADKLLVPPAAPGVSEDPPHSRENEPRPPSAL